MFDIINVGNKADLRTLKLNRESGEIEKEYRTYKSKILDFVDESTIKMSMPIEGGNIVLLPIEGIFEIFFYTESGLYQSKGKVVERLKENNLFIFIFELLQPIKKNQRREFYRFNCVIDMKYVKITESESEIGVIGEIEKKRGEKIEWSEGFIVDISGGGIRFTTNEEIEKDSYIIVNFNLMINHRMKQFSIVIKMISSDKIINHNGQYECRGKYVSISKGETEEIIRYIFEEERKALINRKS